MLIVQLVKHYLAESSAKTEAARIRQRLGMTQPGFASLLGIPVATLRKWEIGPSQPSGAARTLLLLAEKHPALVKEAAGRARRRGLTDWRLFTPFTRPESPSRSQKSSSEIHSPPWAV